MAPLFPAVLRFLTAVALLNWPFETLEALPPEQEGIRSECGRRVRRLPAIDWIQTQRGLSELSGQIDLERSLSNKRQQILDFAKLYKKVVSAHALRLQNISEASEGEGLIWAIESLVTDVLKQAIIDPRLIEATLPLARSVLFRTDGEYSYLNELLADCIMMRSLSADSRASLDPRFLGPFLRSDTAERPIEDLQMARITALYVQLENQPVLVDSLERSDDGQWRGLGTILRRLRKAAP